jgi:hypothetical protein
VQDRILVFLEFQETVLESDSQLTDAREHASLCILGALFVSRPSNLSLGFDVINADRDIQSKSAQAVQTCRYELVSPQTPATAEKYRAR